MQQRGNMAEPLQLYVSIPSKAELQQDIRDMQQDENEHPEYAAYFETEKEALEKELAVLDDPRNRGVDPNTRAGAENLFNQIEAATKGLEEEGRSFLQANPGLAQYGLSMLSRHWVPV